MVVEVSSVIPVSLCSRDRLVHGNIEVIEGFLLSNHSKPPSRDGGRVGLAGEGTGLDI